MCESFRPSICTMTMVYLCGFIVIAIVKDKYKTIIRKENEMLSISTIRKRIIIPRLLKHSKEAAVGERIV